MGTVAREKEIETWSGFIEEFLKDGGVIFESKDKQKREVVYDR